MFLHGAKGSVTVSGTTSLVSLLSCSVKYLIKSLIEFSHEDLTEALETLTSKNSTVAINCQAVGCPVQQIGSLSELLDLWRFFPKMVMENTDGKGVPLKVSIFFRCVEI